MHYDRNLDRISERKVLEETIKNPHLEATDISMNWLLHEHFLVLRRQKPQVAFKHQRDVTFSPVEQISRKRIQKKNLFMLKQIRTPKINKRNHSYLSTNGGGEIAFI